MFIFPAAPADARVVKVSFTTGRDGCRDCHLGIFIYNPEVIIIKNICHHHNINIMSHFRVMPVASGLNTGAQSPQGGPTATQETSWTMIVMVVTVRIGVVAALHPGLGNYRFRTCMVVIVVTPCSWPLDMCTSQAQVATLFVQ